MSKKKRQNRTSAKNQRYTWGSYVDWTLDPQGLLVAVDEVRHRLAIQQPHGGFDFLGQKGDGNGQFHYPRSIEILNQRAYVVDSWNHRVQLFELPAWKFIDSFGGEGDGPGQFFGPSWITVVDREEGEPWLVIAGTNNHRLSFHDTAGNYLFVSELFNSRYPAKVRTENQMIEVQYEDGRWRAVI